jgi:hypothetical protein
LPNPDVLGNPYSNSASTQYLKEIVVLIRQLGLISESQTIPFSELGPVSAALQKQTLKDLAPIWEIQATVDAFASLEDVPPGYWPIIVKDDINVNAAGIHEDDTGQPFALVQASDSWSLTASHEALEMLVDPFGKRLVAGQSPIEDQDRVEFLVEVCDPSEAVSFGYTVNGVSVSDFYTPNYFDPVTNSSVRYSFTGAIKEPRQVLAGGYLSWHDPVSDHWFQETYFGAEPEFRDLGILSAKPRENFRRLIYDKTPMALEARSPAEPRRSALFAMRRSVNVSTVSRAKFLQKTIAEVIAKRR